MHDLVLRGGRLLDGTGASERPADVAIRDGHIAAVSAPGTESAARTIDVDGCVIAPGFIDTHAHDDFNLPLNPCAFGKLGQGVTTVVNGNCGYSPAPVHPERLQTHRDVVKSLDSGLDYSWTTMAAFLDAHPASGFHTVLVNGTCVLDDGRATGATPGYVLRPRRTA